MVQVNDKIEINLMLEPSIVKIQHLKLQDLITMCVPWILGKLKPMGLS
jgi:hypothetical protein